MVYRFFNLLPITKLDRSKNIKFLAQSAVFFDIIERKTVAGGGILRQI